MAAKISQIVALAAFGLSLGASHAKAQSGDLSIWSWNIAAAALEAIAPAFQERYPDVRVTVEDLGNQQVFDRLLAGCAAGGVGLPDIVTIENREAEIFWNRFPDCLVDLNSMDYGDIAGRFPDFKRTEFETTDGKAFGMPWDSGPVVMFYRRDLYEKAGVDPATIESWDDWIEAGKAVMEANPGVVMAQADLNGDTEWFRMIADEAGCSYYAEDGSAITISQPSCAASLETLKGIIDAGLLSAADWGEKLQSFSANKAASGMYGGWYEGALRTGLPDQSGLWGIYRMPGMSVDTPRAANSGGSGLSITSASDAQEAAMAFITYALATNDGQIAMMKGFGLIPSLLSALEDPYVSEPQAFWNGQMVWQDILATQADITPSRGTPFYVDADSVMQQVQTRYLAGEYESAQAAVDEVAEQTALATGLPIQ